MARASLNGFDELERFLKKLEKPEKTAVKAVDKAAPVLEKALKEEIGRATGNGKYSKGHLQNSIEATKAKENDLGVFAVVKPDGSEDENGVSAAEKLAYMEFGVRPHINKNGTKHPGTKPNPVRQRAVNRAEAECERIMRETVYEEVDKL